MLVKGVLVRCVEGWVDRMCSVYNCVNFSCARPNKVGNDDK